MQFRVAAVVVLGAASVAGVAGASDRPTPEVVVAAGGLPRDLMATPVAGELFSAMWTNEIVSTLADMTRGRSPKLQSRIWVRR